MQKVDVLIRPRPNAEGKYECRCSREAGVHYVSRARWYVHNPVTSGSRNKRLRLDQPSPSNSSPLPSLSGLNVERNMEVEASNPAGIDDEVESYAESEFNGFMNSNNPFDDGGTSVHRLADFEDSEANITDDKSEEDPVYEFEAVVAQDSDEADDENEEDSSEDQMEELLFDESGHPRKDIEEPEEILKRLRGIESYSRNFGINRRDGNF